ncbi:AAA family ATPase [Micromonospora narathiwatensis]|uniref:Shikimate kinase n=1 Tax=Micromonospora narathiwatensis TaxID=299146 RepID=A0A1A9AFC8_9ACTN|nr:AAA family ATPase [Micromonospora narathiwatensis]SBT54852.1 shikimate kinase [Micromonospora narathiwatensis]
MKVLVTGMSGTGKSTALQILAARGHRTVDTDTDRWSHWVRLPDGSPDWIWREQAIADLLAGHDGGSLFVAGCKSNQGRFYPQFDHVVLLSAPADVLLARIASRTNNPYGKRPDERAAILRHLATVEPRLRATATVEIDTSAPIETVVQRLEALTGRHSDRVRPG